MKAHEALAVAADPIGVSTLQAGLSRFSTPEGYVAFVEVGGVTLTLGAPVCAARHLRLVTHAFLAAHPAASFFYVTAAQAEAMGVAHPTALPVGVDTVLPLPLGQVPDTARAAKRKAEKAGLQVTEGTGALASHAAAMREVQQAYLARCEVQAEMRFLNRPCQFEEETLGRTFLLQQRGAVVGFVVLDPYRTRDGGQGYLLNLFRLAPTKLWNVYQAVVLTLAEVLAAEGVAELSLGFVPLARSPERLPWWLKVQRAVLGFLARQSPYLRRLGAIKHGFQALSVTRLMLSPRRLVVRDFRAFLAAMNTHPVES